MNEPKLLSLLPFIQVASDNGVSFDTAALLTFVYEPKDEIVADRIFLAFRQNLTRFCFGKNKYERVIPIIAVIEGVEYKRLHIHAVIERPEHKSELTFNAYVRKSWQQANKLLRRSSANTRWKKAVSKTEPIQDQEAFLTYMSKDLHRDSVISKFSDF